MVENFKNALKELLKTQRPFFAVKKEPNSNEFVFTYQNKETNVFLSPKETFVVINNQNSGNFLETYLGFEPTVERINNELQTNAELYGDFMSILLDDTELFIELVR